MNEAKEPKGVDKSCDKCGFFYKDRCKCAPVRKQRNPPRPLRLEWRGNNRDGKQHEEWSAPCGCAYHPEPAPHVHPCAEHKQEADVGAVAWHSDEIEKELRETVEFMQMLKADASLPSNIRASAAVVEARLTKLTGDEFVPVDYLLERERLLHRALKDASPSPEAPTITNAMKAQFIGEFSWQEDAPYYSQFGTVVEHTATRTVPWDLCKRIYKEMTTFANQQKAKAEGREGMSIWDDEEERALEGFWALGDYTGDDCENCGRNRVCKCPNGKHRCEKCNWVPEDKDYCPVRL